MGLQRQGTFIEVQVHRSPIKYVDKLVLIHHAIFLHGRRYIIDLASDQIWTSATGAYHTVCIRCILSMALLTHCTLAHNWPGLRATLDHVHLFTLGWNRRKHENTPGQASRSVPPCAKHDRDSRHRRIARSPTDGIRKPQQPRISRCLSVHDNRITKARRTNDQRPICRVSPRRRAPAAREATAGNRRRRSLHHRLRTRL